MIFKKQTLFLFTMLLLSAGAIAQLNYLPQGSPRAKVMQRVGITDIIVEYSRPQVKDRVVWGNLVPYGLSPNNFGTAAEIPWRAGANENTTIHFPADVKVEGKELKSGTYGLHMIPKEDGSFTVIFSHNSSSWGSYFYNEAEDALRVEVMSEEAPHHEMLTYEFISVGNDKTTLALFWAEKQIPVQIEIPTTDLVISRIKDDLRSQAGFSRQSWEQAAGYALQAGEIDQAEQWINAAIAGNFFSQKTFQNLATKSAILKAKGNTGEADKALDEAISMANMAQLNTLGYQLLGQKNFDKAIEVFELNAKNNPSNANVFDSLGEGYKQAGMKDKAIANLKKSLSLNPPAAVKANSLKLLKELGVEIAQ
ncbi:DUF2911 domain-containing protein [Jiulongibacter sediminis]|jgi:tetratricopeptide (TPR) repeat protein|uniref:DUF2911 domain-containing protein n=1 Tax=Jiulongibacter sediminis TaxID=1605367 RepID=UPI0026EE2895|nr:DUF2911 domain-containing protein [Jiulongibacter sediminis]